MGMYTELIFGAELKKDTPKNVIEALNYMTSNNNKEYSNRLILNNCISEYLFKSSSSCFGVDRSMSKMWFNDISGKWVLSTRSNIKNYHGEIEAFLKWIKPYIESGSGCSDMYAIVTHEYSKTPEIYYLNNEEDDNL